jgi:SAM-dependent methyltransferase
VKSIIEAVHGSFVHSRRVETLAAHVSDLLPKGLSVLDVGCGDGLLAAHVTKRRPDLRISGIDVLVRDGTHVPVKAFDGTTIPFPSRSIDAVLFVDVLHHTVDPLILLREAVRVSRGMVVLKDHTRDGFLAGPTLRVMDWVGNAPHGVALPYNYLSSFEWRQAFDAVGLRPVTWRSELELYPVPASWIFERSLHFIASLSTAHAEGK